MPAAGFPLRLIEVGALNESEPENPSQNRYWTCRGPFAARTILRISARSRDRRRRIRLRSGHAGSGTETNSNVAFEPNVVPGFANRIVARWVSAAAVHFEEDRQNSSLGRTVTGVPVRQAFFETRHNIQGSAATLLVFGGSQGAHAINQAMIQSLAGITASKIPGSTSSTRPENVIIMKPKPPILHWGAAAPRCIDLSTICRHLFSQADLIVCRSGASTVAEIAAAGKPAVFVPFPRAADDHQKRNAAGSWNGWSGRHAGGSATHARKSGRNGTRSISGSARVDSDGEVSAQTGASDRSTRHRGHGWQKLCRVSEISQIKCLPRYNACISWASAASA